MLYYTFMDATIIVKIQFSEKSCGTTSRVTSATIKTQEYV